MIRREANRARGKTNRAVASGQLPPAKELQCVDCGAPAVAYDHRDLDRPLDVEPVCLACNNRRGPAVGGTSTIGALPAPSHISVTAFAKKRGLSGRRIRILCEEARIPGAFKTETGWWLIPAAAVISEPPSNSRVDCVEAALLLAAGKSQKFVAERFGVTPACISQLKRRGKINPPTTGDSMR